MAGKKSGNFSAEFKEEAAKMVVETSRSIADVARELGLNETTLGYRDGGTVGYGGGKLAADLTLPKPQQRWAVAGPGEPAFPGQGLSAGAARAVLRNMVTTAAGQAQDEAGFFDCLRAGSVLVRLRFSDADPGQVTGYSVGLSGHDGGEGAPLWYGGARLAAGLALPRLRRRWDPRSGSGAERSGAFRFTAPERDAIFEHAARQAASAAEHIRRCARDDPGGAADAAWAASDTLHVAAHALGNPQLRRAADGGAADGDDRRTRRGHHAGHGRGGSQSGGARRGGRRTTRGAATGGAGCRGARRRRAAACRHAASQASAAARRGQARPGQGRAAAARVAFGDFPASTQPTRPSQAGASPSRPAAPRGPLPPTRAGPGR